MSQYLVSICIPTYNRASYLKKCLDSLVCQPEFQRGLVEIVISDNDSTDKTEEMAKAYQMEHENIAYYKNKSNVLDQNFLLAISRAHGRLRKLNNDTSIFHEGSLHKLCVAAQKYEVEKPILFWANKNSKIKQWEVVTNNLNSFATTVSFLSTWIGAFAIWDSDCVDLTLHMDQCQTHLWQVWELAHLLENGRKAVLLNAPILDIQFVANKDISYGLYQVFFTNYLGIWNEFANKSKISGDTLGFLKKDLLYGFFLPWVARWELQRSEFTCSATEDLKTSVFQQYEKEPYFSHFLNLYKREILKMKFKRRIKNFPVVGDYLIRLKQYLKG